MAVLGRYPRYPKLIVAIEKQGLTRKDVAVSVGISKSKMTRIIYGEIELSFELAKSIALRLNEKVENLFY